MPPPISSNTPQRRQVVRWLGLLWAGLGTGLAVPILRVLAAPLTMTYPDAATPIAEVPLGIAGDGTWQAVILDFGVRDGWAIGRTQPYHAFVRRDGEEVQVISAVCTHLGCEVAWMEEDHRFHCPCHGARFESDGSVAGPPATKPLPMLPFRIEQDRIVVELPPVTNTPA